MRGRGDGRNSPAEGRGRQAAGRGWDGQMVGETWVSISFRWVKGV